MLSRCGIKCDECKYREENGCRTCHIEEGHLFWGQCSLAQCSITRGFNNCSECSKFVCKELHLMSYDDTNGDQGERIENLKVQRYSSLDD